MAVISFRGLLFLFLGFMAIIIPTAPISSSPTIIETPDILICLIFSWLLGDSKSAPIFSILALCLLADILWHRPLGLWPMFVLLASEFVRSYRLRIKNQRTLIKFFYFLYFFVIINLGVKLFSVLGALKSLDFVVWSKHFLFTMMSFPIINIFLEYTVFRRHRNL